MNACGNLAPWLTTQHLQLFDANENVNPERFWTIANDSSASPRLSTGKKVTNLKTLNVSPLPTLSLALLKCKIDEIILLS